jgi:hypothetical protein
MSPVARLRSRYGAGLGHAIGVIACLAISALAVRRWFDIPSDVGKIVIWFIAALLGHDLVLVPIYSLADRRVARLGRYAMYVRVPAILSALMFAAFWPEILQRDPGDFEALTDVNPNFYLRRWLIATAVLFAISALAAAGSAVRRRTSRGPDPG